MVRSGAYDRKQHILLPAVSSKTRSELVVLIRDPTSGEIFGQIDIDSHLPSAFGAAEEAATREQALMLGARWRQLFPRWPEFR